MMTPEVLSFQLNNCEYRDEISKNQIKEAKDGNLVVVFGASDDLVEFRGAIYDEVGAYEETKIFLNPEGLIKNECSSGEDCPYFASKLETAHWIKSKYTSKWEFSASFPIYKFRILEEGEAYGEGFVFKLQDLHFEYHA